jgi:ppGpp synthetase/RelA/SpoT-type nucleotidyltranferase
MTENEELLRAWNENPLTIKEFLVNRPAYLALCAEVSHILQKGLQEQQVKVATITSRAKELDSFIEKLSRKEYDEPFKQITDFAGVRVVYLYKSERVKIESLIEDAFTVVEKVNKVDEQEADQFGYGALHYLVTLNDGSLGARYDDLKGLVCEVQVRTILQDAWALVAHNMSYKQESDVPKEFVRKLNSLSGLFETADDYFDFIRSDREVYIKNVARNFRKKPSFENEELNLDTFQQFIRSKFGVETPSDEITSKVLKKLISYGYDDFQKISDLLSSTEKFRAALNEEAPVKSGVAQLARAMGIKHPGYEGLAKHSTKFIKENMEKFSA